MTAHRFAVGLLVGLALSAVCWALIALVVLVVVDVVPLELAALGVVVLAAGVHPHHPRRSPK